MVDFYIRGVSFEDRQQRVRQLEREEPVLLIREPKSSIYFGGIAIKTIAGEDLGWVPTELKSRPEFGEEEESFAEVQSWGPAGGTNPTLYGVRVRKTKTVPVTAPAYPSELEAICMDLGNFMSPAEWQRISNYVLKVAKGRCCISGPTKKALTVEAVWRIDDDRREIVLVGFRALRASIKELVENFVRGRSRSAAKYARFMGWQSHHASVYQQYVNNRIASRSEHRYTLDLAKLDGSQIQFNTELEQFL